MSALNTIKAWFTGKTRDAPNDKADVKDIIPESQPLDRDIEGNILHKQDIISHINAELERRKAERQPLELQWQLNLNFYTGNQHCDINLVTGDIEQYGAPQEWMSHEVFNLTAPLIETRMAHLQKVSYAMTVIPRTNELDDLDKASVSTSVLRYKQDTTDFDSNVSNALAWSEITGTCFYLSWWDLYAGETVDSGQNLNEGDIEWGLLTPYEVYPESIFKQEMKEQRSMIVDRVMTVDEIYDLYGIHVEGESVDVAGIAPTIGAGGYGYESSVLAISHRTIENAKRVTLYFERPSRLYKHGRMAIVIGEELVYYNALPYDDIPVVALRSKEIPGQFFGRSAIQDLIPLQRAYNRIKNDLHDAISLTAIGGLIAEEGSIDVDEYADHWAEPGGIVTYHKGYAPPQPRRSTEIPAAIKEEIQQLKNDMEYVSGVSQLMVTGKAPSGVQSGVAITALQDIDNTRMSLTGEELRKSIRDLGVLWLYMYKRYAKGYRVLNITGLNAAGAAVVWSHEDINNFDVQFEVENELKTSEETQQQQFLAAYEMGLFTDDEGKVPQKFKARALELMKIGNYSEIMSEHTLHTQRAQRENTMFEKGVMPEISELDNHNIHIDEHTRYALQYDFELYKKRNPQFAEFFIAHIRDHEAAYKQEQAQNLLEQLQQMGQAQQQPMPLNIPQ